MIAAERQRTTFSLVSQQIGDLLRHPWEFIRQHPKLRDDGDNVAIYWEKTGEGSIEVGVRVTARFQGTETGDCSATPSGLVATTAHFGPYAEPGAAHDAVWRWCQQRGYRITLPFYEIYGDWEDNPSKLRTDVLYLLAEEKALPA